MNNTLDTSGVIPKISEPWPGKGLLIFGLFSLIVSLSFFWDGMHADFSSLSSDQYNTLAICAKEDYPQFLEGDLTVGDIESVKYYTPAFVAAIRILSLPDHNYIRGLNNLTLITSLVYMWGWFFLFSFWADKWIAGVAAFLVRGIMWPPGNELWGIAGIWTMVPRTPFLALLPWMLGGWLLWRRHKYKWPIVCFICGLLSNVHPISGAGVAVALLLAEAIWTATESRSLKETAKQVFIGGGAIFLGMLPFIWTYLSKLGNTDGIDPAALDQAIRMRIRPILLDPWVYLSGWLRPQWLILILLPWAAVFLVRKILPINRPAVLALLAFCFGCLLISIAPFFIESVLRSSGHQARFAFQLVRTAKYILVPSIILGVAVISAISQWLSSRARYGREIVYLCTCLLISVTFIAKASVFDRVPVIGDDTFRFLWPRWNQPGAVKAPGEVEETSEQNMVGVLNWIKANTPENAKFVGPRPIRAGTLRPVIHDWAGAVVLIEGNPKALIEAAKRQMELNKPEFRDPVERSKLIASWGADYWVTTAYTPQLNLAYADSGWYVYALSQNRYPSVTMLNPVQPDQTNP
jgi:hypothetical protein